MTAKKKGSALAKTSAEENEAIALEECGDFFDNLNVDGLEDVGEDDLRLASKIWNMGGLDKSGNAYPKNVFFDTVTEETQPTLACVMLLTQKSNRYDEYDNEAGKTIVHCQSADRVTGTFSDGTKRDCNGCPDRGWFEAPDGKRFLKCGDVHTAVAIESETLRPFLIRFKKTGLKPFRTYLMQHHIGARVAAGKRANIPLFAYSVGIGLKMDSGGKFARPALARGPMLSREEMQSMHESAKGYLEIMGDVLAHADAQDEKHASAERDPSLASDDFADD